MKELTRKLPGTMSDYRRSTLLLTGAAALLANPPESGAVDASNYLLFSKGPLLLRPRLGVAGTYNDNIFSQEKGQSDFVTTISPGLNVQLGRLANNFVALDYSFNQNFYVDRSELNAGEHSFGLRNRIQGERLVLTGSDSVQLLSSPIGLISEYRPRFDVIQPGPTPEGGGTAPIPGGEPPGSIQSPEIVSAIAERNVNRKNFSDGYSLGYGLTEKTGLYLQGQHLTTDYEEGIGLFDINTLRATAGFGFQVFPKIGFFGEMGYGQTATSPNFPAPKTPHVESLGGSIGARGNFTPKLSGTVKVGYEAREFSDNTSAPSSPVVDASLSYRATQKGVISFSFARLHDVSIQYGSESYTANVVSMQWDQLLGSSRRWRASVGGRYGAFDYESPGSAAQRSYDQYSASFRLAYQIQLWLSANLGYTWESIRSGAGGGIDYDINRVALGVAIGY